MEVGSGFKIPLGYENKGEKCSAPLAVSLSSLTYVAKKMGNDRRKHLQGCAPNFTAAIERKRFERVLQESEW